MGTMLAVAFVDDHPLIRRGFAEGLSELMPEIGDCVAVGTVTELLDWRGELDIVLLDLELGDGSCPEDNVALVVQRGWRVLLYTQETRGGVVARCLRAGAAGIVGKHEDLRVLATAVRTVTSGGPFLSAEWAAAIDGDASWKAPHLAPREREALRLYAAGLPLKSVAHRMGISAHTAREHLLRVRAKYADSGRDARTRTDLFRRAVEDGVLPAPTPH